MRHDVHVTTTVSAAASIAKLALALLPAICSAHQLSATECAEGGDFIKNAALARDSGVTQQAFIGKIHEDIQLIQAFPPPMRWFVQDEDDAAFLLQAANEVFQNPQAAGVHQSEFFKACIGKSDESPMSML